MKNNEKAWPGSISRPVTAINRKVHRFVKVVDGERPRVLAFFRKSRFCARMAEQRIAIKAGSGLARFPVTYTTLYRGRESNILSARTKGENKRNPRSPCKGGREREILCPWRSAGRNGAVEDDDGGEREACPRRCRVSQPFP